MNKFTNLTIPFNSVNAAFPAVSVGEVPFGIAYATIELFIKL